MTAHLTDDQLNELLDGLADASIHQHLDTCSDCRARLEDLRAVFTALESLPEATLTRDLTASILAHLPQKQVTPAWKWLFAAQTIGALAIASWLASFFELPAAILAYQPPTFDSLLASFFLFLTSFSFPFSFELPSFDDLSSFIFHPSSFTFPPSSFIFHLSSLDLQSTTIVTLVVAVVALWVVGNGVLLRAPAKGSRR